MTTISDVAKRAGVSPVTVSRVINNAGNVNSETRARVQHAIAELGYVPSGVAQSLRSKRTRALALIVPDIQNPFWTTVARGVEDAAQSRGYSVFLCNTDESPAKQSRYLDVVISQRVDGVMIAPHDSDAAHLAKLRQRSIPTVVIDRTIHGWDVDSVNGDSVSGARALIQHLISLGHRRIAVLSGPASTSTAVDRVVGYRVALAEAGIPYDPDLVRFGEFRSSSGERMANEILDAGLNPTAFFATNNSIAVGIVAMLEQRGLRAPHDIALVCFDDFPNTANLLPFFTVAAQPVYEMGVNAAQLLLSRLEGEAPLQPRHVILPTRLIIRHSCGSKLQKDNGHGISLPLSSALSSRTFLVPRVSPEQISEVTANAGADAADVAEWLPRLGGGLIDYDKPDINRLLKALRHQEPDRVPHLELWVTGNSVYEYVLERELGYHISGSRFRPPFIRPEDHVEFAQRLGMDAVACDFSWRPNNVFEESRDGVEHYVGGGVKSWADLNDLEPPPSLAGQLTHLERYLRAAQGTGVGVIASFTSFFDSALLAVGFTEALYLLYDNRPFLEWLMDVLVAHQESVMRAVCDRFADDLAFVLVNDNIAHNVGPLVHPAMFAELFPERMQRLVAPARERAKLLAFHTDGRVEKLLPLLHDIGFDAIHPVEPECNDIFRLKPDWAGKLALIGNVPTLLLKHGSRSEIEDHVRDACERLGPGGGYVLGSSAGIIEGVPPESFIAMIQAVHRHGRRRALGRPTRPIGLGPKVMEASQYAASVAAPSPALAPMPVLTSGGR